MPAVSAGTSFWIGVLLVMPIGLLTPALPRFVLLNNFDVLTNLVPFSRLDGSLLLGDLIDEAVLHADSRRSLQRSVGQRRLEDGPSVVYALIDGVMSAALFAISTYLWWYLFGEFLIALATGDVVQQLGFVLLAALILGPTVMNLGRWLGRLHLVDRARFRSERALRVRAIRAMNGHLDGAVDQIVGRSDDEGRLGAYELSLLAGQLEIHRVRIGRPAYDPTFRGWVLVPAGVRLETASAQTPSPAVVRIESGGFVARRVPGSRHAAMVVLPERALELVMPTQQGTGVTRDRSGVA